MSDKHLLQVLRPQLDDLMAKGLYKRERQLEGPQGPAIRVGGREVLNFCANNYLGLANHPAVVTAAADALLGWGYGMASVRFICGTQDLHKDLEGRITRWLGKDDAILYTSCFDANTGLFETILTEEDTILSDELNHASIIDGIRLCKAQRFRYGHSNMADLDRGLKEASGSRLQPSCVMPLMMSTPYPVVPCQGLWQQEVVTSRNGDGNPRPYRPGQYSELRLSIAGTDPHRLKQKRSCHTRR